VKKGSESRDYHPKGRSPFIDRLVSPNYGIITLQLRLSYMMSGAPG
jgi:hypothetical protein